MAQSKYIQSVLDAAKDRPKSTAWYREKIKEFGKVKPNKMTKELDRYISIDKKIQTAEYLTRI